MYFVIIRIPLYTASPPQSQFKLGRANKSQEKQFNKLRSKTLINTGNLIYNSGLIINYLLLNHFLKKPFST